MELREEARYGRGSGGDGRAVELLQPLRKSRIDNLYSKTVKRVIAPQPYDRLGAADSGGCSSATTPLCPFLIAENSGSSPCLSGLLGLTASSASSIFTTPSYPSRAVHQSGADRCYLIVRVDVVSFE